MIRMAWVHRTPLRTELRVARELGRSLAERRTDLRRVAHSLELAACGRLADMAASLAYRLNRAECRWHDQWVRAGMVWEDSIGLDPRHPDAVFTRADGDRPRFTWEPCDHDHGDDPDDD